MVDENNKIRNTQQGVEVSDALDESDKEVKMLKGQIFRAQIGTVILAIVLVAIVVARLTYG